MTVSDDTRKPDETPIVFKERAGKPGGARASSVRGTWPSPSPQTLTKACVIHAV